MYVRRPLQRTFKKRTDRLENMAPPALIAMIQGQGWYFSSPVPHVRAAKRSTPNRMPTEWHEGKEKFERWHVGDDQLLRGTQKCGIFFKGTQVKASSLRAVWIHPSRYFRPLKFRAKVSKEVV